jgi:two-component system heavy metal sensor histidine kinase CusS
MSSKIGTDTRPWSLALRLTLWYALTAFSLVLVVTGYLYVILVRNLEREDDEWLAAKATSVLRRAMSRPDDLGSLRLEAEDSAIRASEPLLLRVRTPAGLVETPGMASTVPFEVFPSPGAVKDYQATNGQLFRLRAEQSPDGTVVVTAALNRSEDEELVTEYRQHLAIVLGMALLICAAGGYGLARRGLRPIAAVTATARRIGPAHLSERLGINGLPTEVHDLATTFNDMLNRIEDAFARLARFSADIAHELRTPVNVLRGEVEVALGRPRTIGEYQDVLGSCLEEYGRLTRLIDNLLFLARAEDPKTVLGTEAVDVGQELVKVREFFDAAASDAGVQLTVSAQPDMVVAADRGLFHRAIGNLVSNSLAHTISGGKITLQLMQSDAEVRVEVVDTGEGISPEHLPYLFDRFYRADRARSAGGGRVGLGLSIVKGIVELHGGTVSVKSEPGQGTTISLTFPVRSEMTKL